MRRTHWFRTALALLVAAVLASGLSFACAEPNTERTQYGGAVDMAGVLSTQTIADLEALNGRSDLCFTVVTRHFLGGAEAQSYCDSLFRDWRMDENEVLLLLVIGEERYAVSAGSRAAGLLSTEQVNNLLSTCLREPFLQRRDYDAAVGDFIGAYAEKAALAEGVELSLAGLFGKADTQTAEDGRWSDFAGFDDLYGFYSYDPWLDGAYDAPWDGGVYEYEEEAGGSLVVLLVIVVLLILIVRRRRQQGKSGLGLFGWLVASRGFREVSRASRRLNRRPRWPR